MGSELIIGNNMQDAPRGEGRTETENKERGFMIEGVIMGLARSLALGKLPGIYKNDPS